MDAAANDRRGTGAGLLVALAALLLIVAVLGGVGYVWGTATTRVTAYVEVRAASSGNATPQSADVLQRALNDHQVRIKSPTVLSAALASPGVVNLPSVVAQRDPVAWLANRLIVRRPSDGWLLMLHLEGHDDLEDRAILNAVLNAFEAETADYESPGLEIRIIQPPDPSR